MAIYTYEYDYTYSPSAPIVELEVGTQRSAESVILPALIDSGADATLLPKELLIRVAARPVDTRILRTVTGARSSVSIFSVWLHIGPFTLHNIRAVGVESIEGAILGSDALNQLVVTMNGLATTTEISQ